MKQNSTIEINPKKISTDAKKYLFKYINKTRTNNANEVIVLLIKIFDIILIQNFVLPF